MARNISIGDLADVVMDGLNEYARLATEDMKESVRSAGKTVRKEIKGNAPKDIGEYGKSWRVKTVRETSQTLAVVVHSRNRYQLAHLLEYGHALRDGGRYEGEVHIAPAEELGIRQLQKEIERALKS